MKTIELTDPKGKKIYISVNNIFSIKEKPNGGSFIKSNGGDIASVKEPPSIVNDLIKKV